MKAQFGMFMTGAAGKSGGQYIQRWRGQFIVKKITMPVQRMASVNNPQRKINEIVWSRWKTLAEIDKVNWATVGDQITTTDKWGNISTLTARNAFNKLNSLIYPLTGEFILATNVDFTIPLANVIFIDVDEGSQEMVIRYETNDPNAFWQIKVKKLISRDEQVDVDKLKTFVRQVDISDEMEMYSLLSNEFGEIRSDDIFSFAIRQISLSGIATIWQQFTVTVN